MSVFPGGLYPPQLNAEALVIVNHTLQDVQHWLDKTVDQHFSQLYRQIKIYVGNRQFRANNFLTKVKTPLSKFGTMLIFPHDQAVVSEIKFITQSLFIVVKECQRILFLWFLYECKVMILVQGIAALTSCLQKILGIFIFHQQDVNFVLIMLT